MMTVVAKDGGRRGRRENPLSAMLCRLGIVRLLSSLLQPLSIDNRLYSIKLSNSVSGFCAVSILSPHTGQPQMLLSPATPSTATAPTPSCPQTSLLLPHS